MPAGRLKRFTIMKALAVASSRYDNNLDDAAGSSPCKGDPSEIIDEDSRALAPLSHLHGGLQSAHGFQQAAGAKQAHCQLEV